MSNYSDNKLSQISFEDYLPEVYRSDTTKNMCNMVFDRLFSKDDTVHIIGVVGASNSTTPINNQIVEISNNTQEQAHRQAFQLAPTMYNQIGTVQTALSFQNFLSRLSAQGVDIDRLPDWGAALEFNWVPPINIDKLVNYQDYFWNAPTTINSPQYLTIENRCNNAADSILSYQNLIEQRGLQLSIISVDIATNTFILSGKWDTVFTTNFEFSTNLSNVAQLNGTTFTTTSVLYNSISNQTNVTVLEQIVPLSPFSNQIVGDCWFDVATSVLFSWSGSNWIPYTNNVVAYVTIPALFQITNISFVDNSLYISGKQDDLFVAGFVFLTKNSSNINMQNKYWTIGSVTYDSSSNVTIITTVEPLAERGESSPTSPTIGVWWYKPSTNILFGWNGLSWNALSPTVSANISLAEVLLMFQAQFNCVCNQLCNTPIGLWTDASIGNLVLNPQLILDISQPTIGDWLTYNATNLSMISSGSVVAYALWYDTTTNELKQYSDLSSPLSTQSPWSPSWNTVVYNCAAALSLSANMLNNNSGAINPQLSQWTSQNKWQHKAAVSAFTNVQRAQIPIFEYDSNIELNEWTKVDYVWKYRATPTIPFSVSSLAPSRIELEPIKGYQVEYVNNVWQICLFDKQYHTNININLTEIFISGYKFRVVDDTGYTGTYTVDWSEFRSMIGSTNPELSGDYMATIIYLQEPIFTTSFIGGVNNARIVPNTTTIGDVWQGYSTHWVLDSLAAKTSAVEPQMLDIYKQSDSISIGTVESIRGNPIYTAFVPQVTSINYGKAYQELIVDIDSVSRVDLIPQLLLSTSNIGYYATPNSNELRVYINGVRQYGTYTEITALFNIDYTAVGSSYTAGSSIEYVTSIVFQAGVTIYIGDVIKIEVGPAAFCDMGLYAVPVRTVEDDVAFDLAVSTGTQPSYQSLTTYQLREQVKTDINQYPLFNVYDVITGKIVAASPIIAFTEDPTAPINNSIQRRIVMSVDGIEFEFEQFLVSDTGYLYGYRNNIQLIVGQVWYSPITNLIQFWTGDAWSNVILIDTVGGNVARSVVICNTDPINLWSMDEALWYNTNTNTLYIRNTTAATWNEFQSVLVNDADPTLLTIWRHGPNNEQTVPQCVDAYNNIVPIDSSNGDWGVVDQWIYNPEHRNLSSVLLSQITPHFRSILKGQSNILGAIGGELYSKNQYEYNYGIGGTIKEYNGSFDTLISATMVAAVTPVNIIEFASTEYAANLRFIRDVFNNSIMQLCSTYITEGTETFSQYICNAIINLYEENNYVARIYGDTSAYNNSTNIGVRNWIATAPMFGLALTQTPHLLDVAGFTQIYHHDGHRTTISYSAAEEDIIARQIVSLSNGIIGLTPPPYTEQEFITQYGGMGVHSGLFWYDTSSIHNLYRFELYTSGTSAPSFYYQGAVILDGVQYYNTTTHNVYKKVGFSWVAVSAPDSYDISSLWIPLNLQTLLGNVYLEVENRLYAACNNVKLIYDYTSLQPTQLELNLYQSLMQNRFNEYVANYSIPTPLVNTHYNATDAFSWNYYTSVLSIPPYSALQSPSVCWQSLYTTWFGTPYPHLEPWKLQGFVGKPTWWDLEYKQTDGSRMWIFQYGPTNSTIGTGMWQNIYAGQIPIGCTYPDGRISTGDSISDGQTIRTYTYVCVNITNSSITGGYLPDQLLPPYYNTTDSNVRSLFTSLNQIIVPNADYTFGDGNPIEWLWRVSAQYPYENPIIAYLMQPVKFFKAAFGPIYTYVAGLEVDTIFGKVYSHKDALFHGDLYGNNEVYTCSGLNQWYVNFNRYSGYDISSDFRENWVEWTPLLTYQFNNIIDTSTLTVTNPNFDIIPQDYNIVLSNTGTLQDLWVDAFNVNIVSIPPAIVQYNNQNKWRFELNSLAAVARTISYYDVKAYPFIVDTTTSECSIYKYTIDNIDSISNRIYIIGNVSDIFIFGSSLNLSTVGSVLGVVSVVSSIYDSTTDTTRINVLESLSSLVGATFATIDTFVFPWSTGDMVVLSSEKLLPAPLVPNTPYYIINMGNYQFKLAETILDSQTNQAITLKTVGIGIHTIAEIASSFNVLGGQSHSKETWYHYALDKSKVLTLNLPQLVYGMQTLIDIVDGHAAYQQDLGVIFNTADSGDFDPTTGRLNSWALEVERFIDWAYGLRQANLAINDRFDFNTNVSTNMLTAVDAIPHWPNGTAIQASTSGTLPTPLNSKSVYYVVQTGTNGVIQLSASQDTTQSTFYVNFTTQGSGQLHLAIRSNLINYPSFEINPTRNNIWLNTPSGMLSNVLDDSYANLGSNQNIFDQYGRALGPDKLAIYRQDERNRVSILPQIANDVDPFYTNDPYNFIHLGGGHFTLTGYEHFLVFNSYSTGNVLIYDSFFGLHTTKFNLDFFKNATQTSRPTLGGYFLNGQNFIRNVEGAATDLQTAYDTYTSEDGSIIADLSRNLLGYTGQTSYMDLININPKTQFLFYRGMLHAKGSSNCVIAYTNSRRLSNASVDEYWAVQVAEFGDNRMQVYPEILLSMADSVVNDIRFEFIGLSDDPMNVDTLYAISNKGFNPVSFSDESRWNNFPDQRAELIQPLFLDAEINSLSRILVSPTSPTNNQLAEFDYWFNTIDNTIRSWNNVDWSTIIPNKIHLTENYVYWHHDELCDDIRVLRREVYTTNISTTIIQSYNHTSTITAPNTFSVAGDVTSSIYPGATITITGTMGNDGAYIITSAMYDGIIAETFIVVTGTVLNNGNGGTLTYVNTDFSLYTTVELISAITGIPNYYRLNSEVVRIDRDAFFDIINIYTIRPSSAKLNPAKLIDRTSDETISQISLWHPAFGMYSYKALFNIDIQQHIDPASYSNTMNPSDVAGNFWNFTEVGTVWLDTSYLAYIPYYDPAIFPDINNRLYQWGNTTDYAEAKVYQWVRSAIPPAQWDAMAIIQQGNISIPASEQITGIARQQTFCRTRESLSCTVALGPTVLVTIPTQTVSDGQLVIFPANTTLPTEFQNATFIVANASNTSPQTFNLLDVIAQEQVSSIETVVVSTTMLTSFVNTPWNLQTFTSQRISGAWVTDTVMIEPTLFWSPIIIGDPWNIGDSVLVYINGVYFCVGTVTYNSTLARYEVSTVGSSIIIHTTDNIDIVRPIHTLTATEQSFDPISNDDYVTLIQWTQDYQYSQSIVAIDASGNSTVNYYFWVEQSTTSSNTIGSMPLLEINTYILSMPDPYFIVQRPLDSVLINPLLGYDQQDYGVIWDTSEPIIDIYANPIMYREAVIRNISQYINTNNSYMIQFTRDLALRKSPSTLLSQLDLKDKHQVWLLFREQQIDNVPQFLWDKLIESLTGISLTDGSTVPTLDRQLYDAKYGTSTRYGLDVEQAFVDGKLGLQTVLNYLNDPTIDFMHIDLDDFFNRNNFSTVFGIVEAMTEIYNTFGASNVNGIWFATLQDALSTKAKYSSLMKTSWISLQSTQTLNVNGLMDI